LIILALCSRRCRRAFFFTFAHAFLCLQQAMWFRYNFGLQCADVIGSSGNAGNVYVINGSSQPVVTHLRVECTLREEVHRSRRRWRHHDGDGRRQKRVGGPEADGRIPATAAATVIGQSRVTRRRETNGLLSIIERNRLRSSRTSKRRPRNHGVADEEGEWVGGEREVMQLLTTTIAIISSRRSYPDSMCLFYCFILSQIRIEHPSAP
jgi:hypothetical protein